MYSLIHYVRKHFPSYSVTYHYRIRYEQENYPDDRVMKYSNDDKVIIDDQ